MFIIAPSSLCSSSRRHSRLIDLIAFLHLSTTSESIVDVRHMQSEVSVIHKGITCLRYLPVYKFAICSTRRTISRRDVVDYSQFCCYGWWGTYVVLVLISTLPSRFFWDQVRAFWRPCWCWLSHIWRREVLSPSL